MASKQPIEIKDINYNDTLQAIISLVFNQTWYQEDIARLKQLVVERINNISEIEHVKGADRETIRLSWYQQIFILNFECYSESCWIEAESENEENGLYELYTLLTK